MPRARVANLELEYDVIGDDVDPVLLLVGGLGQQLIGWELDLCKRLAGIGLRVVRYDHRDVGLSTKLDGFGVPKLPDVVSGKVQPPYSLADLADDAVGLLDWLSVETAHVLGASMGGMVAQTVAVRYPERVRKLVSVMSTTGEVEVPPPTGEALEVLLTPPPLDRDARIAHNVNVMCTIASPGFPFDMDEARRRAIENDDRCFYPQGIGRQLAAVMGAKPRVEALRGLSVSTLVLHGEDDPLVHVAGGRRTAAAIPGAILRTYPGMGHDLPEPLWDEIVGDLAAFL